MLATIVVAAKLGSELELRLEGAKWVGTVKEPYNPPLRGRESDRVPRAGESYVKDFRRLSLGVVVVPFWECHYWEYFGAWCSNTHCRALLTGVPKLPGAPVRSAS